MPSGCGDLDGTGVTKGVTHGPGTFQATDGIGESSPIGPPEIDGAIVSAIPRSEISGSYEGHKLPSGIIDASMGSSSVPMCGNFGVGIKIGPMDGGGNECVTHVSGTFQPKDGNGDSSPNVSTEFDGEIVSSIPRSEMSGSYEDNMLHSGLIDASTGSVSFPLCGASGVGTKIGPTDGDGKEVARGVRVGEGSKEGRC